MEKAEETEYWELAWPVYVLMNLAEEMFHNLRKIWEYINYESWTQEN